MTRKYAALSIIFLFLVFLFGCRSSSFSGEHLSTSSEAAAAGGVTAGAEDATGQEAFQIAQPEKYAAITFDDGPGRYTEQLLDGLAKRDVRATFFMIGQHVKQYPQVVRRMAEEGHQIGTHTYDHIDVRSLSVRQLQQQIDQVDAVVLEACGKTSTCFRPPFGYFKREAVKNLEKMIVLWSVDTMDWKTLNAEKVVQAMLRDTKDGSIVLLHDIYQTSVDGVLRGIDLLQKKGFRFVTVDELIRLQGGKPKNGIPYYNVPRVEK